MFFDVSVNVMMSFPKISFRHFSARSKLFRSLLLCIIWTGFRRFKSYLFINVFWLIRLIWLFFFPTLAHFSINNFISVAKSLWPSFISCTLFSVNSLSSTNIATIEASVCSTHFFCILFYRFTLYLQRTYRLAFEGATLIKMFTRASLMNAMTHIWINSEHGKYFHTVKRFYILTWIKIIPRQLLLDLNIKLTKKSYQCLIKTLKEPFYEVALEANIPITFLKERKGTTWNTLK